jgi:hypothetical protein
MRRQTSASGQLKINWTPIQSNSDRQITSFHVVTWPGIDSCATLFSGIFRDWGREREKVFKWEQTQF